MCKRVRVFYSGRVQGVGFRYSAVGASKGYNVAGWVKNLSDGRVELVAEGEEKEISAFLAEVSRTMNGYIQNEDVRNEEPLGDVQDFSVAYR